MHPFSKYRLILVNGAMGVGKTWLAKELARERPGIRAVSLTDSMKRVMSAMTGLNLFEEKVYADFKNQIFENGLRGRDWQIQVSESAKEYDPLVWVKRFMDIVKERTNERLVICDSFGFPIEFHGLIAREDVDCLTVYIDDAPDGDLPNMVCDGDYRQFANDSRFDLSRHCTIRALNSTKALIAVRQALKIRNW